MTNIIIPSIIFIYGLMIGSFLNVCIYRVPLGKSVVSGRSYCPCCSNLIPWYRNIPLFSYIFLKGRCGDCNSKISPIYPFVELLNAILWLWVWLHFGLVFYSLLMALFCSMLIIISFIDLSKKIIPDGLVLALAILGLINGAYQWIILGNHWSIFILGFFAASLPLYILALIHPEGMGGGDIKFMAAAGLFTGYKLILLSLFLGAIYALIYAGILLLLKKPLKNVQIPFGPFLSLAIVTSLFFGDAILNLYLILLFK